MSILGGFLRALIGLPSKKNTLQEVAPPSTEKTQLEFDLNCLRSILSIPHPRTTEYNISKEKFIYIANSLEEQGHKHHKNNNTKLAIACFQKARDIYDDTSCNSSSERCCELASELINSYKKNDGSRYYTPTLSLYHAIGDYGNIYTDGLVMSDGTNFVCDECTKYTKRIFSIDGKDKRYPKLPDYFFEDMPKHQYCSISFFPILHGISPPSWDYEGDLLEFCNRPFEEQRTVEQIKLFNEKVDHVTQEHLDRKFYELLCERCPHIAPKSFGGFRNMKAKNSKNYQKLMIESKEYI